MKKITLAISILLFAAATAAQNPAPVPAPPLSGTLDTDSTPTPRYQDNVRPLGGVQNFDLGDRTDLFNLLSPALDISQSYGTNPGMRMGPNGETVWGGLSNLGGSLRFEKASQDQQFSMSYRGAAQINSYDSTYNTQAHSLKVVEGITAGRWNYVFGDEFSFEPNAYGASSPLLFPGTDSGPGGFRPGLGPDSTIYTLPNTRLSNTAIGQVSYGLSRNSILSGSVSYGLLHYTDLDLLDSKQLNANGGYTHRFGRNTIGLNYTYSDFRFSQINENFNTHVVEFAYGRRIIGRWAVELAAGPTLINSHVLTTNTNDLDVNARATIQYAGPKTNFGGGYTRGVTAGAGIAPGAVTDSFSGNYRRRLSQTFTFDANGGYSRNSAANLSTTYNTVFAVANVTHQMGRYITVSFGYSGQKQTSNQAFANLSSHAAVVTLHWGFRPIRLE